MSAVEERYAPTVRWLADEVGRREGGAPAALVRRAYRYAAAHHDGEVRRSGDPYISHCVAVAIIVAEHGGRGALVAAALLHDVLEHRAPEEPFRRDFGAEITRLVVDVTRLDKAPELAASVGDDVVFLKLADRLHNLQTIRALSRDKQIQKAEQARRLMVPLAVSMGCDDLAQLLGTAADRTLRGQAADPAAQTSSGRGLLRAAALLLPARDRTRWLGEWQAELAALPTRWERWRFAVDVALGCPRLAVVMRRRSTSGTP